jgi:hypothetical protein
MSWYDSNVGELTVNGHYSYKLLWILEKHNIYFIHEFCDCSVSFSKHAVYGKSHCLQIYAVILKLLSHDVVANVGSIHT